VGHDGSILVRHLVDRGLPEAGDLKDHTDVREGIGGRFRRCRGSYRAVGPRLAKRPKAADIKKNGRGVFQPRPPIFRQARQPIDARHAAW